MLRKYHRTRYVTRESIDVQIMLYHKEKEESVALPLKSEVRCDKSANRAGSGYQKRRRRKENESKEDTLQLTALPVIPRSRGRFNIDSENIRNLSARAGRCRDRELEVHGVFI